MIPISAVYICSIKSHHSYHSTFTILSPIVPLYRLSIVSLYRHHCTFPIQIAYKIIYTTKWMLRGIPQFRQDCGISMQWDHDFSEFTVPFRRPTTLWVSCILLSEISVPMWETVKCHAAASHVLNTPDQWLIYFKISSNSDCSHHPCPSPDISIKLYLWSI